MMTGSGTTESRMVDVGNKDKDTLFLEMCALAKSLHVDAKEIELVVVNIGPGGFTGLRTSIAVTKMIAMTNSARIVAVEAAVVVAEHAELGPGPFFVCSGAKKDSFWLSKVSQDQHKWLCSSGIAVTNDLVSQLDTIRAVFADDYLQEETRGKIERCGVRIYPTNVSALSLLRVGLRLFRDGETVLPERLLPIYPREPEAVRLWKERGSDSRAT